MLNTQNKAILYSIFFFLGVALFPLNTSAQTSAPIFGGPSPSTSITAPSGSFATPGLSGSPTVSISHAPTSPTTSDSVVINVLASDVDGIQSVTIFVEQVVQKECANTSICQLVQRYSIAGAYTYYVKAIDKKGFATMTSFVSFTVSPTRQSGLPSSSSTTPSTPIFGGPSPSTSPTAPSIISPSTPSYTTPSAPIFGGPSPSTSLTNPISSTSRPAACVGITFSRSLAVGSSGADVKCLQVLLNRDTETRITSSGTGSPGYETVYFGALTKNAVAKFQERYRSEVLAPYGLSRGTGFIGASTRAKLNAILTSSFR